MSSKNIQKADFNFKEIGLQRLSLSSEDGSWRDEHFATNFMKIR